MKLLTGQNKMSAINHRIWLRIKPKYSPLAILKRIFSPNEVPDSTFNLVNNLSVAGGRYWYIPLTGPVPSYVFESTYQRQTPDWGQGGRFMMDLLGGAAKTAGKFISGFGAPGAGKLGGWLGGVGSFFHAFTGDIDSPKIWERTEFKTVEITGRMAFESMHEFKYYKAADIMLTSMTAPVVGKTLDYLVKLGKKLNMQRAPYYEIITIQRPFSEIAELDIVVGEGKDISVPGATPNIDDKGSLVLFALDKVYLSAFSAVYGGQNNMGWDNSGVPRIADFTLSFEIATLNSAIFGFRRMLRENDSRMSQLKALPVIYQDTDTPPQAGASIKSAVGLRSARTITTNLARMLMFNVLNMNLSAGAVKYIGARTAKTLGPVRVIISPSGASSYLPAGIPGFIYNRAQTLAGVL